MAHFDYEFWRNFLIVFVVGGLILWNIYKYFLFKRLVAEKRKGQAKKGKKKHP